MRKLQLLAPLLLVALCFHALDVVWQREPEPRQAQPSGAVNWRRARILADNTTTNTTPPASVPPPPPSRSPPPPPIYPPVPFPPSPPSPSAPPKIVRMTLDMDFNKITDMTAFIDGFEDQIYKTTGLARSLFKVSKVSPGSVVVEVTFTSSSASSSAAIDAAVNTIVSNPNAVLSTPFKDEFGIKGVTATPVSGYPSPPPAYPPPPYPPPVMPSPPSSDDDDGKKRRAVLGGAIGGCLGGALLIAIIAFVVIKMRRDSQRTQPAQPTDA